MRNCELVGGGVSKPAPLTGSQKVCGSTSLDLVFHADSKKTRSRRLKSRRRLVLNKASRHFAVAVTVRSHCWWGVVGGCGRARRAHHTAAPMPRYEKG